MGKRSRRADKTDFYYKIDHLEREYLVKLDKLRSDLLESFNKSERIYNAFVRELAVEAPKSTRLQDCLKHSEIVLWFNQNQHEIIDHRISEILDYPNILKKKKYGKVRAAPVQIECHLDFCTGRSDHCKGCF